MAEVDESRRNPMANVTVLARRLPLLVLIALPIAFGAILGVNTLGRSYESVSIVTFSPRPNVLVAGDVLRLSIPRYATFATAEATLDAAGLAVGAGPDDEISVRAEIPPETINLHLTVAADSADLAAAFANQLASDVVATTDGDDLLSASVLVAATVPESTSGPSRPLLSAAAILLALAIAAAVVLMIEVLRPRVWTVGDARSTTGSPALGVIPSHRAVRSDLTRAGDRGALAQQVRALRWQVDSLREREQSPVLVVTSPHEGDGKTTIAALLAVSLAQLGRRVALVDGDFGSADLTTRLGASFSPSSSSRWIPWRHATLPNWLPAPRPLARTARDPVRIGEHWWRSSVPDLLFLPGDPEPTGGDSLAPFVGDLFEALRFEKDWVIVDAPALFGDDSAEVLVSAADMVLLVVETGTQRRSVKAATNVLAGLGAPLVGTVVNRSNDLPG